MIINHLHHLLNGMILQVIKHIRPMTKDGAPIDDVVEDTWLGSATNNSGGGTRMTGRIVRVVRFRISGEDTRSPRTLLSMNMCVCVCVYVPRVGQHIGVLRKCHHGTSFHQNNVGSPSYKERIIVYPHCSAGFSMMLVNVAMSNGFGSHIYSHDLDRYTPVT